MSKTKEIFLEKGIVKSKTTKALEIFSEICSDFTIYNAEKPSEFIDKIWKKYLKFGKFDNSINGKIFEYILSAILINKNLLPFYTQAKVAFVPNADYDLLFYCKEKGPIALSAKTSLRERYKQADLEAVALKYVYRKSESYLITMDETEAKNIQEKVKNGEVIGINKVIYALNNEFNELLEYLQNNHKFIEAGKIDIITHGNIVK